MTMMAERPPKRSGQLRLVAPRDSAFDVSIVDANMRTVHQIQLSPGAPDRRVDLEPGNYLVLAEKDRSTRVAHRVEIKSGATQITSLSSDGASPHEWVSDEHARGSLPPTSFAPMNAEAERGGVTFAERRGLPETPIAPSKPTNFALRLFEGTMLHGARGPFMKWKQVKTKESAVFFASDYIKVTLPHLNARNLYSVGVLVDGRPAQFCPIPAYQSGVDVVVGAVQRVGGFDATLRVLPRDSKLASLVSMLDSAKRESADALWNAYEQDNFAERILEQKYDDPAAACVGGLFLLRFAMFDRMHNWPANLAAGFKQFGDGAVIEAWRLWGDEDAEPGRVRKSPISWILEASHRPAILFSYSRQLMVDALIAERNTLTKRGGENVADEKHFREVVKALKRVDANLRNRAPAGPYAAFYSGSTVRPIHTNVEPIRVIRRAADIGGVITDIGFKEAH